MGRQCYTMEQMICAVYGYVLRLGAFALAILDAGGTVAAGLGTRWGWHFRTGFTI